MTNNNNLSVSQFIQEAYIEPIRSVLIIDDQYPTWEDWLSGKANANNPDGVNESNLGKFEDIKKIIGKIREMNPARIVDIQNSDFEDLNLRNYMHQSDLLILDYDLDPNETKQGEIFLGIARKLLYKSNHFNLILTHTVSDDLSEPFAQLLRSFLNIEDLFPKKVCEKGDGILDKFDNSDKVKNSIWHDQYAAFRLKPNQAKKKACSGEAPYTEFHKHCKSEKLNNCELIALLMRLLKQYETIWKNEFNVKHPPEGLAWSTSQPYWLKTNCGFIAFTKKSDSFDVVSELKKALASWNPTPSRLLSARLRAEIESQGSIFEESFLSDKHVAWMFYQKLFKESSDAQETNLRKEIQRQMEHYTDAVSQNLVDFGKRIVASDSNNNGNESQYSQTYNIDFSNSDYKNKALDNFNSFISCKPRTGNHLTPGHIFLLNDEIWVVLSPACDLVPSHNKSRIHSDLGSDILPFIAAKLFKENRVNRVKQARKKANSTNYVFLQQDGNTINVYRFYNTGDNDTKAPQFKTFFAKNGGRFNCNGIIELIYFSRTCEKVQETIQKGEMHNRQLRYEYALNLIAKLSVHSSRIGLEYENLNFFH